MMLESACILLTPRSSQWAGRAVHANSRVEKLRDPPNKQFLALRSTFPISFPPPDVWLGQRVWLELRQTALIRHQIRQLP